MEIPHELAFLIGNPPWKVHFPMDFPHGKNLLRNTLKISIFYSPEIPHGFTFFIGDFPSKVRFPMEIPRGTVYDKINFIIY